MNAVETSQFPIASSIVQLNHASYGIPTLRSLALAECIRRDLDSDSTKRLGAALRGRIRSAVQALNEWLGLGGGQLALTSNATTSAASTISSLPMKSTDNVVVLSTEYSSVARAWQHRAEEAGATYRSVDIDLPLPSTADLLSELDRQVHGRASYVQASLVTSSSAVALPLSEIAAWTRQRDGLLIVDAAHGPGHVDVAAATRLADAVFGTLHKWLPVPRSCGFIWLENSLASFVRPAVVSLTWDETELVDRFAWPGTFDPAPWLCLPDAIQQWEAWQRDGKLDACARLSALATDALESIGALATTAPASRPPRLQAAILPGVSEARLREALDAVEARVWVGESAGSAVVRVATHVYNDESDVERLLAAVSSARR